MKIISIINGPNLNLLGKREPEIYGTLSFEDYFKDLQQNFAEQAELHYFQSNSEGALLDYMHHIGFSHDGIVLNGGAYTHTSVAIGDAIKAIATPVVEVHISNVHAREAFRQHSYFSAHCAGVVVGFGLKGYNLAIQGLL